MSLAQIKKSLRITLYYSVFLTFINIYSIFIFWTGSVLKLNDYHDQVILLKREVYEINNKTNLIMTSCFSQIQQKYKHHPKKNPNLPSDSVKHEL